MGSGDLEGLISGFSEPLSQERYCSSNSEACGLMILEEPILQFVSGGPKKTDPAQSKQ